MFYTGSAPGWLLPASWPWAADEEIGAGRMTIDEANRTMGRPSKRIVARLSRMVAGLLVGGLGVVFAAGIAFG